LKEDGSKEGSLRESEACQKGGGGGKKTKRLFSTGEGQKKTTGVFCGFFFGGCVCVCFFCFFFIDLYFSSVLMCWVFLIFSLSFCGVGGCVMFGLFVWLGCCGMGVWEELCWDGGVE